MTKQEFDGVFKPMTEALQVKVTRLQADYYYKKFGHHHYKDFKAACEEMALSTPGYLPKNQVFTDYVQGAREMRLHREKDQEKAQATQFWQRGPVEAENPMDLLFQRCCFAIIKAKDSKNKEKQAQCVALIQQCLGNDEFVNFPFKWRTRNHQYPLTWLKDQLERLEEKGA